MWNKSCVNFRCNKCDHTGLAVKCIQLQQLKKQIWSWSRLNFSGLLFQLLKLNTFNCEDHYFRIFTDKVGENRSKQWCTAGCQNEAGMHSVTYLQRRYEVTPEWLINHGCSMCATVILKCFQKINDWHICSCICHQEKSLYKLCQKHLSTCIMVNLITARSQVMVCLPGYLCLTNNRTYANSTPEWLFCLQKQPLDEFEK